MSHTIPSAGLIPDQLLSNIKKGNCVLFLGADLPLGYEGAPLSRPELAQALAEKYHLAPGRPWPEMADSYLDRFDNDWNGLVSFIAARCSGPQVKPGPLHQAVAQAGFRAIVTAWYDELLEEALRQAGCRVNRVVRDTQLPYVREGEREVIVIKLYGCLSDPQSLALTTWDHAQLMVQLSRKLKVVTAFCSIRPPLFVGFDLTDVAPIQLYAHASADLVEHMQRAHAVWQGPLDAVRAAWRERNVEFIQADAAAFLKALAAQLPAVAPSVRGAIRVNRPPYKFLDYYVPDDADIFCGRETESQIVTRLALSHRLLTLFGPSGAGKTSLLLAGVVPRLAAEHYQHVYVRALDDPLPALRKEIAARAGRADWQAGQDLREFLAQTLAPQDRLVVVLDQFEELFLRVGSGKRAAFFKELAAVLAAPERDARFVLSLREDYLAHLDEARGCLPDIFTNSFRLAALDRGHARVAITEPAARAGVVVEPALVDALVGGEGREAGAQSTGDLVEADGRVPPAALQIVLDYLYRAALPEGHAPDDPPPPGVQLTVEAYRSARHRLGEGERAEELQGARAILAHYVREGLARLPDLKREDGVTPLGADTAMGEAMLKVMVTSQRTKAALTHDELLAWLDEVGVIRRDDKTDQELVENTRLGLERVRLLRGFERDGTAYYELAHDHLAAEIATWIGEEEMQAKLAREMLRRALDNWRQAKLLLPLDALELIHACCEELRQLKADELELLFRSALAHGYEVGYWFERACKGEVAADSIALESLKSENFRTRAAAVKALEQLGEQFVEPIIEMLADVYPQVRVAAIHALEQLQPSGEWRAQLKYECYVPEGEFVMGDDQSGDSDERPAHEVDVDAFYIGRYPVTNADYKRYMDDSEQPWDMPAGKEDHPVVSVSWYQARNYARWAGMRLLTEAEWEKAASWEERPGAESVGRGAKGLRDLVGRVLQQPASSGKKRKYPWGDSFDESKCNTSESRIGTTTPVGKYSPAGDSPYGVADMAGNVWEWTSSLHKAYPYKADDGREDSGSSKSRVVRGGSFYDNEVNARCAYRNGWVPGLTGSYGGVRCGFSRRSLPPAEC